jgi:hypothetical protein
LPYLKLVARRGEEVDIERSLLGKGTALALAATISLLDRVQAEVSGERHWLDADAGSREVRQFTASVARARLTCTIDARSLVRVTGRWEQAVERGRPSERSFSGSALYGYRLNWQSILYVGYDNGPAPSASGRRHELFVKLAYAFRP